MFWFARDSARFFMHGVVLGREDLEAHNSPLDCFNLVRGKVLVREELLAVLNLCLASNDLELHCAFEGWIQGLFDQYITYKLFTRWRQGVWLARYFHHSVIIDEEDL